MKKQVLTLCAIAGFLLSSELMNAQNIATFDDLTLAADSYWNGADTPMGTTFTNGNAIFPSFFDTTYGGYWTGGWAYSNIKDTTTGDFTNLYSAYTGKGFENSANYAIGQQNSIIILNNEAIGKSVKGLYITNGTYPALSMKNGDFISKKFGGETGNDPDWFKLTIRNWYNGTLSNDSVEFYLADYRFEDNTKDYIVNTWQWVDLALLGHTDSLQFILSSSDNGAWGMNTPSFFCIDNFTTDDIAGNNNINLAKHPIIHVFPNPVNNQLHLNHHNLLSEKINITIYDVNGKRVYSEYLIPTNEIITFDASQLQKGIYFVNINDSKLSINNKFVKE